MFDLDTTDPTQEQFAEIKAKSREENHGYKAPVIVSILSALVVFCAVLYFTMDAAAGIIKRGIAAAQSRPAAAVSYPTRANPTDKPMPTDAPTMPPAPTEERPTAAPTPYPTFTPLPTATERAAARPVATVDPARAVAFQQKMNDAKTAGLTFAVFLLVLILCLIAMLLVQMVQTEFKKQAYWRDLRKAALAPPQEPKAPDAPKYTQIQFTSDSGRRVDWATCPIDDDKLRRVAELILLEGRTYSQGNMCGDGKPLSKPGGSGSVGTFKLFGDWMVEYGIAKQLEDGRYVIDHKEVFQKFVG
jgi:hypothetical protein